MRPSRLACQLAKAKGTHSLARTGWYTDIKYLEVDFCELNPESGRYSMGVTAIVRVRLPDGASHEDIGYGKLENTKSKGDGLDKVSPPSLQPSSLPLARLTFS